jgi:hypothetical protein
MKNNIMRKKTFRIHFPSIIIFLGFILLAYSCEDNDEDNNPIDEKVDISVNIGNNDGASPLYIYGPRDIDFSVSSDKGNIDLVQFFYQGAEIESFTSQSGKLHFTPDMSKEDITNLEMKVTVTANQKKYYETVNYRVQYVKISEEDFELKDATIDRFVFKMVGKKLENYKYILNGKVIEDLDNITIKRKFAQFSFPIESNITIILVPIEQEYIITNTYPYVELAFEDKKLGDFHVGSTLFHYIDIAHDELYIWSLSELSIFDRQMNEMKHQSMEDINKIFVTPKTGLIVVKPLYGKVLTYLDKNFTTIISTIDLKSNPENLRVSENDQLFNGHNFQIDVYNLYTGKSVYSIHFHENVGDYTILGDKLLVRLGNDGQGGNEVYQLNEKSATLLYTFEKTCRNCIVHPINRNHIILDNTYNGFEIFDLDSQMSLLSFKGQFQSIDPITGNLLYYDENYGSGAFNTYDNHVIDLNYNKIFTFEDASQSTYGAFLQFNNYVIKSDRYTYLLPKELADNKEK